MKIVRMFMAIIADKSVITKWFVQTPFNTKHIINFLRAIAN